jgi:hypothetical protein
MKQNLEKADITTYFNISYHTFTLFNYKRFVVK